MNCLFKCKSSDLDHFTAMNHLNKHAGWITSPGFGFLWMEVNDTNMEEDYGTVYKKHTASVTVYKSLVENEMVVRILNLFGEGILSPLSWCRSDSVC